MRLLENAAAAPLDYLTTAPRATVGGRARHRRGWYTRRALAATDVAGLSVAFVMSTIAFADRRPIGDHVSLSVEVCLFFLTLLLSTTPTSVTMPPGKLSIVKETGPGPVKGRGVVLAASRWAHRKEPSLRAEVTLPVRVRGVYESVEQ